MAQQSREVPQGNRRGQEGSRWYNERPSGEAVAKWFEENVPLHDGLDAKHYVTGITLIPAKERGNEVIGYRDGGAPIIEERQNLVFTPYPRVDIRIKYFHDLMAMKAEEWYGVIEPVPVPQKRGQSLPPGFFTQSVPVKDGVMNFVVCTMKVTVWLREGFKEEYHHQTQTVRRTGVRLIDAPPATKQIAVTNRYGDADTFALMKAETGAIGRALGMAGMLVVPGAGVATAEDMGEVDSPPPAPVPEAPEGQEGPQGTGPTDDELRAEATRLIALLEEHAPGKLEEFKAWAKERGLGKLSETVSPALKGVVRQLERKLTEAEMGEAEDEAAAAAGETPPQ